MSTLREKYIQRNKYLHRKTAIDKVAKHTQLLLAIGKGNYIDGARIWNDIRTKTKDPLGAVMRQRRNRRSRGGGRGRGRGRRSRVPAALKPTRIPVRRIVMYEETSGSAHRWYYPIPLSLFVASFKQTFDEFKVISMTVKYIPNNSLNETGLYTAIMLDREGFGSFGSATAVQWFEYLGCMPGSVIKPRHASSIHRWKPTEPSARDWIRGDATSKIILATIYICNNGKETEELGGLLEIRANLLFRGRYWNASVSGMLPPSAVPSTSRDQIEVDPPSPQPQPISRCSSRSSLIGGFHAL